MEIKRDWVIAFDEEQIIQALGHSFTRLLQRPRYADAWRAALEDAQRLVQPAAVWDVFPIAEFRHQQVILSNGVRFGNGPVTTVMGGASHLLVGVCTVGQAISQRIQALQEEREMLQGMLLDSLASWAVDAVRGQLCYLVEQDATRQGRRVSAPMSPGESEWSVEDQAILFSLLDASQIGVSLSTSMVMHPLKSLSIIIGTGSQPIGIEDGDNCMFCSMKERCRYRHHRPRAIAPPT